MFLLFLFAAFQTHESNKNTNKLNLSDKIQLCFLCDAQLFMYSWTLPFVYSFYIISLGQLKEDPRLKLDLKSCKQSWLSGIMG